jgi:hypothetical protein
MSRLITYALLAAALAGCTSANGSTPPSCGPWEEVDLDQRIGPDAISANDAYALMEGRHEVSGNPAALFVDITRGAVDGIGRSRAQIASPDRAPASRGACGMRMTVEAHVYNADRTIDVNVPVARLSLHDRPHATFETLLPGALPSPYPSQAGLTLAVSLDLTRNQGKPKVGAQLRLPIDRDPRWTWGE